MKLCDYMYFNKITSSALAKELGCSRAQITIAKAGKKVSKWFARDLERATNGAVTVAEIIPLPKPKPEAEENPIERVG